MARSACMNIENVKAFLMELNKLESRHGIYISCAYDPNYDYDYEGNMYDTGLGQSYMVYTNKDGEVLWEE